MADKPASTSAAAAAPVAVTVTDAKSDAKSTAASDEPVPYFAIGSMINKTSLNLRDIFPSKSVPGELKGWELVFLGLNGMASVNQKDGASTHGVLHYITPKEMEALDKIEASYARLPVDITLYDGTVTKGFVYQMDHKRFPALTAGPANPPSERYIDIITRGCVHYGVKDTHIAWLKSLKVVPRRKPCDYFKIPDPNRVFETVKVTCAELAKMDGNDGRPLGICINLKVMVFNGDMKNPSHASSYNWAKTRFSGKDNTVQMSRTLYEPLYPVATKFSEMSADHRASAEDFYASNWTGVWAAYGLLVDFKDN